MHNRPPAPSVAPPLIEFPIGTLVTLVPEGAMRSSIDRQYHHEAMFRLVGSQGIILRYTGPGIAFVRFVKPSTLPSVSEVRFSIPTTCLVALDGTEPRRVPLPSSPNSGVVSMAGSPTLKKAPGIPGVVRVSQMCVVCGRTDRKGEARGSGFKCKECVGKKSLPNLKALSSAK